MKRKADIALEFDEFSKDYTSDMVRCVPQYLKLVSSFVENLPENFNPTSILDLGCGNGNITAQLLSCFPNSNFTLVDASTEMIQLCRKKFRDYNITYSHNYFQDFEFNAEKYDMIVAGFSLHHLTNKEKRSIFKKIHAALRKGGIFSYSDLMINKTNPNHPKLLEEWGNFVNSHFPNGEKWEWVMEHYKEYDKPTDYQLQLEWLKEAGFKNIQIPFKKGYWVYLQAVK